MSDEMDQPEDEGYALVVPFVVCASHGGPYDDEAFVAGWQAGKLDVALPQGAVGGASRVEAMVPPALVPQLDLLGMHHGWTMRARSAAEGWSAVVFERTGWAGPDEEDRG